MRSVYEDKRIPLQVRRLMIFSAICAKAKNQPNKVVHLSSHTKLAFGVIYLQNCRKYIAYGGVFNYAHTRQEVIEQGLDKLPHDEFVMCGIIVKRQAFTRAARTPLGLLIDWNKYVNNRAYNYIDGSVNVFFRVNDELEMDYPPHKFYKHLVASEYLPLWNDKTLIESPDLEKAI